jgi:hypothetical protein
MMRMYDELRDKKMQAAASECAAGLIAVSTTLMRKSYADRFRSRS